MAPLIFRLAEKKLDLQTITPFRKNEYLITKVIENVKLIVDELGLPAGELYHMILMFKGNYMTLRNLL